MAISNKDERIVSQVLKDPASTHRMIARAAEIPESTVAKRISSLIDEGVLQRKLHIKDWIKAGYSLSYRIDVEVDQRQLAENRGGLVDDKTSRIGDQEALARYIMDVLAHRYETRLVVTDVVILLGQPSDLSVKVRAKDHRAILDFVTKAMRRCGGIARTATSQEAWSCLDSAYVPNELPGDGASPGAEAVKAET